MTQFSESPLKNTQTGAGLDQPIIQGTNVTTTIRVNVTLTYNNDQVIFHYAAGDSSSAPYVSITGDIDLGSNGGISDATLICFKLLTPSLMIGGSSVDFAFSGRDSLWIRAGAKPTAAYSGSQFTNFENGSIGPVADRLTLRVLDLNDDGVVYTYMLRVLGQHGDNLPVWYGSDPVVTNRPR